MLFIIPPVGIFFLWKKEEFKKPIKIILSIVFSIWFVGIMSIGLNDKKDKVEDKSKPLVSENSETSKNKEKEEVKKLKINEAYNYKGVYEVVINKVYTTSKRNQFSDKEAKKVIIIDYSYKNISKEDTLFISQMNFKAFDSKGNALDTYPVAGEHIPKAIPSGKTSKGSVTYVLNEGNSIDLYFYNNMFNSKEDIIFNVSTDN